MQKKQKLSQSTYSSIDVKLTPRMPREGIKGIMTDGTVKIQVSAAPVDGKANLALIELLSRTLEIPIQNIEIVSGKTVRKKTIRISNLDLRQVRDRIQEKLDKDSSN